MSNPSEKPPQVAKLLVDNKEVGEAQNVRMHFVPPHTPTPAELRIQAMREAISQLPKKEQEEIGYVRERLNFLRSKFGSSADLAIVYGSLEISKEQGQ
jgi:hypothetical protein